MTHIEAPPVTPVAQPPLPWWRFGIVWMVFGGPALVVVAAIVTAVIAVRGADPVVRDALPAREAVQAIAGGATTPAVQARNHAATPAR